MLYRLCYVILLFIVASCGYGQQSDTSLNTLQQLPDKYYTKVDKKLHRADKKLTARSEKYLSKFKKQESRLQQKLVVLDSTSSAQFANTSEQYDALITGLKDKTGKATDITSGQYNSYIDTLSTSIKFLKGFGNTSKATTSLKNLTALQGRFAQSEKIKQFIAERKQQLKEVLSKYTKLPMSLEKEFTRLKKTGYYYSAQLGEIRETLKDQKKIEKKVLMSLCKLPAFQKFMQKNSQLASLFRMPDSSPLGGGQEGASLAGLQTRASVQSLIQQQIAAGGPNGQQIIQQNLAQAHSELNKLKDKINQLGGGGSDIEMPEGFRRNNQRTKSFWKKWETGINFQNNRANRVMPVSTDLGISAGFKPNNWFIAGVGFAGRIGWGKDIRHISVSYSGISVRSFTEFKLKPKSSFHAVAAFERNYRSEIRNIEQLKDKSGWQSSGLVGLSKVVSLKTKFFKKIKLQLLWDFLSYQQVPRAQPVVFRIGYNF